MDGATQTLLEYLDDGETSVTVFDEPKVVFDKLNILSKEFEGRIKTLTDGGEILPLHREAYITVHELRRQLLTLRKLSFSAMNLSNPIFEPTYVTEPMTKTVTKYYLDPSAVGNDMKNFVLNGARIIFACGSSERAKGVKDSLFEAEISAEYSEDGECDAQVSVTPLKVDTGVIYPAARAVIVGVSECIGRKHSESVISHKRQFSAPKAGDYVVHRVHGVGLCEGTTRMKSGEFEREYIVLKYRDGDTLYVATDQMNNLQKFVGEEHPSLNKIGGKEFEREKERVKKSVRKLAVNYFNSVLRHALDCPVFGVFHSVVSFKYHIAVLDRGYHILELVCSALKKRVCHSRVRFARMVLPSAVAGRLCAELACAYQVAYSRYEYSVLYYLRVVGEYSVVVKEIACYRQRGACSVAHIAYG